MLGKKVSSQYLEITKTYTKNSIAYFFSNTVDCLFNAQVLMNIWIFKVELRT